MLDIASETLSYLQFNECSNLTELNFPQCPSLETIQGSRCGLTILDISNNKSLNTLVISSANLREIRCPNTFPVSSIASDIVSAIQRSEVNDGVVYINDDNEYYSTIADAATAKGWTIEQL